MDRSRSILEQHQRSVWTGKGESRAQWDLTAHGGRARQTCEDMDRQLADNARNAEALLVFYTSSLREVDRLHREFEQAVSDYDWRDANGPVNQ